MNYKLIFITGMVAIFQFNQAFAQLYVEGTLYIDPGAQLHVWNDLEISTMNGNVINEGLIEVEGNWTKSAAANYAGSATNTGVQKVVLKNDNFNINGNQRISGEMTGSNAFQNLEINNTGPEGVIDIDSDIEITGLLSFENGILRTDTEGFGDDGSLYKNEVIISNAMPESISGHSVDGGQMNNFIEGKLRRAIIGMNSSYDFPIGTTTGSQPFTIQLEQMFVANTLLSYYQNATTTAMGITKFCDVGTAGNPGDPFTPDGEIDELTIDCISGQWVVEPNSSTSNTFTANFNPAPSLLENCPDALYWYVGQNGELEDCPDLSAGATITRAGISGFGIFDLASASAASTVLTTSITFIGSEDSRINIFPNPAAHAVVNLQLDGDVFSQGNSMLTVFDNLGRVVHTQFLAIERDRNFWQINTEKWQNGIYRLLLKNENQSASRTLVISSIK